MPKEKLDKYMKEIHYGLSIRQTKTQSSGNPMNQKQRMERRVIKHTLFFWILTRRLLQLQKEGGLDEPLSWISTVSHSHTFKWGDMELLLILQIGRDSLLSTKGKEISLLQVGMLFQSKKDKHCSLHFPCVPTLKVCPFNTTLLSRVNKHLKSL